MCFLVHKTDNNKHNHKSTMDNNNFNKKHKLQQSCSTSLIEYDNMTEEDFINPTVIGNNVITNNNDNKQHNITKNNVLNLRESQTCS